MKTEDIKAAIRREYLHVRKQSFPCGKLPALVALTYARAFVSLHIHINQVPELAFRAPLVYGSAGAIRAYAHQCTLDAWKKVLPARFLRPLKAGGAK